MLTDMSPRLDDLELIYRTRDRQTWRRAARAWTLLTFARFLLVIYLVVGTTGLLLAVDARLTSGHWPPVGIMIAGAASVLVLLMLTLELAAVAQRAVMQIGDTQPRSQ